MKIQKINKSEWYHTRVKTKSENNSTEMDLLFIENRVIDERNIMRQKQFRVEWKYTWVKPNMLHKYRYLVNNVVGTQGQTQDLELKNQWQPTWKYAKDVLNTKLIAEFYSIKQTTTSASAPHTYSSFEALFEANRPVIKQVPQPSKSAHPCCIQRNSP